MNFYEAQDQARQRSRWLLFYYILAVVGVVVAVYCVFGLFAINSSRDASFFDWISFLKIAGVTSALIVSGSLFKTLQLQGGGAVVAHDLGGRPIDPHTIDVEEKRLINVVEEMAIASGVPVPQVWIMDDESSINAFAAGTEPSNAVIGVTRGCVQRLTRGELQGVVAHEFSHILNGDMRLNMRMIGWLFGIMMLSMIGQIMVRSLRHVRVRSNNSRDGGPGLVIVVLVVGVSLMVIGGIGVFFARMIQAAVSRQREFLADASAVEFTRNPSGIAGALKKIGGQTRAALDTSKAGEASHMFFADAGMFAYGMATHPPLEVRIRAIEESWNGKYVGTSLPPVAENAKSRSQAGARDARISGMAAASGVAATEAGSARRSVRRSEWDALGDSRQTRTAVGEAIHAGLDPHWIEACHDRELSQVLVFGLLLAEDDQLQQGEISFLRKSGGHRAAELAVEWHDTLRDLHSSQKIAVLDIAISTLRRLTYDEFERFIEVSRWLIASDGQVDIFEFMLLKMLDRHLESHFHRHGMVKVKYTKLHQVRREVRLLLSTMAGVGADNEQELLGAWNAASTSLAGKYGLSMDLQNAEHCSLRDVEKALDKLKHCSPLLKKSIIHACGLAVMHDDTIANREAELIRAAADAMGCSVPPLGMLA